MGKSAEPELVILVHGTFAGIGDDGRSAGEPAPLWWQQGGEVWNRLQDATPNGIQLAKNKEEFSWSGENSERDRRDAGRELYRHLQVLELRKRKYHLIGHSHGGSVIWNCLLEAMREQFTNRSVYKEGERALPGLMSWTTIGTPFLHLRPHWISGKLGSLLEFLALILPVSVLVGLVGVGVKFADEIANQWHGYVQDYAVLRWFVDFLASSPWLIGSLVGVSLLTAGLLLLALYCWVSAIRLEALAVRQEIRIRNQAFIEFGRRWMGMWSRHDEAINGLRATMLLRGEIAPRISIASGSVFAYDRRMYAYRFITKWLIAPVFNFFVSKSGDGLIWGVISRNMQGNDRPGCVVDCVQTTPVETVATELPSIPIHIDDRLVEESNQKVADHSSELIPRLRECLSQAAWSQAGAVGLLTGAEADIDADVLVHTAYLYDDEVIELVRDQLTLPELQTRHTKGVDPCADWLASFRNRIDAELKYNDTRRDEGLPLLWKSNRRAWLSLAILIGSPLTCCLMVAFLSGIVSESMSNSVAGISALSVVPLSGIAAAWVANSALKRCDKGARGRRLASGTRFLALVACVFYALIGVMLGLVEVL